jgi:hypothetical protein
LRQWLVDEKCAGEEPLTQAKTQAIRPRFLAPPQFINVEAGAMFKLFVGRDEKRELSLGNSPASSDYGMLGPRLSNNEGKDRRADPRPVSQKRNFASFKFLNATLIPTGLSNPPGAAKCPSNGRLKAASQVSGNARRTAVAN